MLTTLSKYKKMFQKKKKSFMPYVCYGYPTIPRSEELIETILEQGADGIEIGFPFSDPVADGPLLTRANKIALQQAISLDLLFDSVSKLRKKGFGQPVTLMSYYNIPFQYSQKKFVEKIEETEIDGVLIPDIPSKETGDLVERFPKIPVVFLIGLNTPTPIISQLAEYKPEYFYVVAKFGVTGMSFDLDINLNTKIAEIRTVTDIPLAVGFGISTPEQARTINADGIIVGSLLTKVFDEKGIPGVIETMHAFKDNL
jgi:tryptophan synthase alpha chain